MSNVVKYMFDRDFDDLEILKEIVEQEQKEAAEEQEKDEAGEQQPADPPPPPTFSEEEMAQARRQAFERGKKEATAEALAGIEHRTSTLLEQVSQQIESVFAAQKAFNETVEREAMTLSVAVVRKLFPTLSERHGLDEVVAVARDVIAGLLREPHIAVVVADSSVESVRERLAGYLENRGVQGEVSVRGDSALGDGDCRIEWMGGDAVRDAGAVMAEIEAAVARHSEVTLSRLEETQG